jgi:thiaminase
LVRGVLSLADRIGPQQSAHDRARAAGRFVTTNRYERVFWEMGYRRETWPV